MQKCIIISIRPEWVEKILNGEKTIEIRKTMPKCNYPIDVYIYCTKGTHKGKLNSWFDYCGYKPSPYEEGYICNGKIVAKFTLNKVDKYQIYDNYSEYGTWFKNGLILLQIKDIKDFYKNSCLNKKDLENYIEISDIEYYQHNIETNKNIFYVWHIDNLEIFNKPMELSEFYKNGTYNLDDFIYYLYNKSNKYSDYLLGRRIRKAPQSWCYAWRKLND